MMKRLWMSFSSLPLRMTAFRSVSGGAHRSFWGSLGVRGAGAGLVGQPGAPGEWMSLPHLGPCRGAQPSHGHGPQAARATLRGLFLTCPGHTRFPVAPATSSGLLCLCPHSNKS